MFNTPTQKQDICYAKCQPYVIVSGHGWRRWRGRSSRCLSVVSNIRCMGQKLHSLEAEQNQQTVSRGRGPEPAAAWSGCLHRNISQGVLWE